MRTGCWIPKAKNIHSQYVILISFPPQQRFTNAPQCYVIRRLPGLFSVSFTTSMVYVLHCDADSQLAVLGLSCFCCNSPRFKFELGSVPPRMKEDFFFFNICGSVHHAL